MASRAELSCCASVGAAAVGVILVRLDKVADAADDTWAELAVVGEGEAAAAAAVGATAIGSDSAGNPIVNAAAPSERRDMEAQVASVVRRILLEVRRDVLFSGFRLVGFEIGGQQVGFSLAQM